MSTTSSIDHIFPNAVRRAHSSGLDRTQPFAGRVRSRYSTLILFGHNLDGFIFLMLPAEVMAAGEMQVTFLTVYWPETRNSDLSAAISAL